MIIKDCLEIRLNSYCTPKSDSPNKHLHEKDCFVVKQLDESIMKYYHGLGDEVGSLDLNYVVKYMKSYILAASFIADNPAQPHWIAGDKYESAWKALYSK